VNRRVKPADHGAMDELPPFTAANRPKNSASPMSRSQLRVRWTTHASTPNAKAGRSPDEHVYIDDGISGAEFANRPGFLRLMNALTPRPPFQVLVMSEESRLGREAIETAYALKQLVTAGVRVFFYLEDRERTLDSPTDKIMLSLTAFADELERERARQRVHDAMTRKARALHVTGNQCFGYRNVDVTAPGPDGRMHRQYVRREVLPEEAAVIRRIFELCASAEGLKGITKTLNADSTPAPRSQRGRPKVWAPSSVREILYRESYRGTVVWNKTRKRDSWGHKRQTDPPSSEWLRVEAESLRIVPEALWQAAHARLTQRRENYRVVGWRAPDGRGVRRHYLLSGFALYRLWRLHAGRFAHVHDGAAVSVRLRVVLEPGGVRLCERSHGEYGNR
jgi:site-specific DNA recombinase